MKKKLFPLLIVLAVLLLFSGCDMAAPSAAPNQESSTSAGARSVGGVHTSEATAMEIVAYIDDYFFASDGYLRYANDEAGQFHGAYIAMQGQGNIGTEEVTTSEAMGYGLRLALYSQDIHFTRPMWMAWYNMEQLVDEFTLDKTRNGLTLSHCNWYIPADFDIQTVLDDPNSGPATDGDMDIAYAYILADTGLHPVIGHQDMREKALAYIRGIAHDFYGTATVNGSTRHYLTIAPSGPDGWQAAACLTRPSDWMLHHLKTFAEYYDDFGPSTDKSYYVDRLNDLYEGTKLMIEENQWGHGIFPDFIVFENNGYRALTDHQDDSKRQLWLALSEDVIPQHYNWNACRYPWRLAEAYVHAETSSERNFFNLALRRVQQTLLPDLLAWNVLYSDYELNGAGVVSPFSTAFAAPAACSLYGFYTGGSSGAAIYKGICYDKNFEFLLSQFKGYSSDPDENGYFCDSINVLSLLSLTDLMMTPYTSSFTGGTEEWTTGVTYIHGSIVSYNGQLWENTFEHTSQSDWYPGAPGLWFWQPYNG